MEKSVFLMQKKLPTSFQEIIMLGNWIEVVFRKEHQTIITIVYLVRIWLLTPWMHGNVVWYSCIILLFIIIFSYLVCLCFLVQHKFLVKTSFWFIFINYDPIYTLCIICRFSLPVSTNLKRNHLNVLRNIKILYEYYVQYLVCGKALLVVILNAKVAKIFTTA